MRVLRTVLIALVLTLAACEKDGRSVDAGRVVERDHRPSRLVPAGKVQIPVSAKWRLKVEDCDPEPCQRQWVRVDRSTYEAQPIGSWWTG